MQRHEFLNHLVDLQGGCERYLEIGCDRDRTFSRVNAKQKTGVDPRCGGTERKTSDRFFADLRSPDAGENAEFQWDLIFVDGMHHRKHVLRDVQNALWHLRPGGVIVLDDCLPREEYQQRITDAEGNLITAPPDGKPWTGNVWKAVVDLRQEQHIDVCTVTEAWGFGVVIPRRNTSPLHHVPEEQLDWYAYRVHRREWLRMIPAGELPAFLAR